MREWWDNGLKVGPNYCRPDASVADEWIDQENALLQSRPSDHPDWWTAFNDPTLNELVETATRENLPLKVAGLRILEAREQRGVAVGGLFAQMQTVGASYGRSTSSGTTQIGGIPIEFSKAYFQRWTTGFDAAWEIDFWGRFRRQIEAADANICAQIANRDDVMVILQAEVAATYVDIRTLEKRLELARGNIAIQEDSLQIAQDAYDIGEGDPLDVEQLKVDLEITRAAVPLLETNRRQARNKLCVLLGMPPYDIDTLLGAPMDPKNPIPTASSEVVVGIPAELLRRRPDVRRAEREIAVQSARIGVATSDLYPHISITGTIGLDSVDLHRLFDPRSIAGSIGPSFRWDVLNYGRILNNIHAEDARFQQAVFTYRETVLRANEDVENAIVAYLQNVERLGPLQRGERAAVAAFNLSSKREGAGDIPFQRRLDSQRMMIREQDRLADGQGNVALRLIALYKSLGGGWRVRYESTQVADNQ